MNDFSEIIRFVRSDKKLKVIPQKLDYNIEDYLSSLDERFFSSFDELYKSLPNCIEKQLLIDNINHVINCFSIIKPISSFKFEITKSNSCQVFHQDYLDLRFVVTYLGPGTEFVTDSNINFEFLNKPWNSPKEHNSKLIKNQNLIFNYPINSICCFKGKINNEFGQFHRSPEIESLNLKRAILILN